MVEGSDIDTKGRAHESSVNKTPILGRCQVITRSVYINLLIVTWGSAEKHKKTARILQAVLLISIGIEVRLNCYRSLNMRMRIIPNNLKVLKLIVVY